MRSRTDDDGMVVEFNDKMSGLLLCNTANLKLGAEQDARNAAFYQEKYISKNPCELAESLSLLIAARKIALRYGETD